MFLLNDFNIDNRVLKEAVSLQKNDFQVYIVATHFNKELKVFQTYEPGIKVIRENILNISFIKYVHFWIKSIRLFRKAPVDVIVCHDLNALPIGVYIKKMQQNKPKLIYDSHEFFPAMISEFFGFVSYWIFVSLEKRLINNADYITTDSPSRSYHLKTFYNITKPITHIYNSYYTDILDIQRYPLKKQPNEIYMVIMGHVIAKTRGFELLPDFIAKLKMILTDSQIQVKLFVLGEGYFRPTIQKIIIENKQDDIVKFFGNLPYEKAIAFIKNCDIGLILFNSFSLNHQHAGPNRIFDYMAADLCVITTELFEISRIVEKENLGWIVPQNYPDDLVNLINEIIHDKNLLLEHKSKGRDAFSKRYSWNRMEAKILKIYSFLLD